MERGNKLAKIGWGVTGAGHFLQETFDVMEKVANGHAVSCFVSSGGERVVRIYGLWQKLGGICPNNYYREIILEDEQRPSFPLAGRFLRKTYGVLVVSPASANTIAKIVRTIKTIVKVSINQRFCWSSRMDLKLLGIFATIPAKMIKERPWPRMPYSEINSPNQMANMVPAIMLNNIATEGKTNAEVNPKFKIGTPPPRIEIELKMWIWPTADKAAMGTAR